MPVCAAVDEQASWRQHDQLAGDVQLDLISIPAADPSFKARLSPDLQSDWKYVPTRSTKHQLI